MWQKISLVGAGMMTHVGVASDMFEAPTMLASIFR